MKKNIVLCLLSIFSLLYIGILGCQQDSTDKQQATQGTQAEDETGSETQATEQVPEVVITVGERSPGFTGAKASFSNLKDGDVLEEQNVSVIVDVENYELGIQTDTARASEIANSAKGQHAHIILDNEPYFADYVAGEEFDIGVLDEGAHTVLVFPSRSYHESVKSEGSVDIVNFYVGEKKGEFMLDESEPTIIYSRPKGKYEGKDAQKIMLDFYLINAELGVDEYKARYTIRKNEADAQEYSITLTSWNPAFVTGLSSGEYIITLQLLDKDGNLVEGAFNNTERTITVSTETQKN